MNVKCFSLLVCLCFVLVFAWLLYGCSCYWRFFFVVVIVRGIGFLAKYPKKNTTNRYISELCGVVTPNAIIMNCVTNTKESRECKASHDVGTVFFSYLFQRNRWRKCNENVFFLFKTELGIFNAWSVMCLLFGIFFFFTKKTAHLSLVWLESRVWICISDDFQALRFHFNFNFRYGFFLLTFHSVYFVCVHIGLQIYPI